MAVKAKAEKEATIEIQPIKMIQVGVGILGIRPLILHRMSQKAMQELTLPPKKSTQATRDQRLKHDPVAEFRNSPYTLEEGAGAYLALPSTAFKGCLMVAALDTPGAKKAQMGRLVHVEDEYTEVYGIPSLLMSVVRSSDIARTPDVRTRCIVPHWGCRISVLFASPLLRAPDVTQLLATGGLVAGVGDWRPEKGKGVYGQFRICPEDDPELLGLMAQAGYERQVRAMEEANPYDRETRELLPWVIEEAGRRGFDILKAA